MIDCYVKYIHEKNKNVTDSYVNHRSGGNFFVDKMR